MGRKVTEFHDTANIQWGTGIGLGQKWVEADAELRRKNRKAKARRQDSELETLRAADSFAKALTGSGDALDAFKKLVSAFNTAFDVSSQRGPANISLKNAANNNTPIHLKTGYDLASGTKPSETEIVFEAYIPKQTAEITGMKGSYHPFTEAATRSLYTIEEKLAVPNAHVIAASIPKAPRFNLAA